MIKAVIMAGGFGTRLRPLTCTMPKPMVPLLNTPVIGYCVALLQKYGISDITVTLHYLPNQIRSYLQNSSIFTSTVRCIEESTPLGTAGSVQAALPTPDDTVLIMSGDALTDANLEKALAFHYAHHAKATLLLKQVDIPSEYGIVLCQSDGKIRDFLEKPTLNQLFSNLANTGMYILEPDVFRFIPRDREFDFSKDLFPLLLKEGLPIYGYEMEGYWCDIGSLQQYQQAQKDLLNGKCEAIQILSSVPVENGIYLSSEAYVSPKAIIESPCYIADGAHIEAYAHIGPYSVIGKNVVIKSHARINAAIIMNDAQIDSCSELRHAVVCPEAHIQHHAAIFDSSVLGSRSIMEPHALLAPDICVWPDHHIAANAHIARTMIHEKSSSDYQPFGEEKCILSSNQVFASEQALHIGAIMGKMLNAQYPYCISWDESPLAQNTSYALLAGLLEKGIHCLNFGNIPISLLRFAIVQQKAEGGVYLSQICDAETKQPCIQLRFLDERGFAVKASLFKKLRTSYLIQDFNTDPSDNPGHIEQCSGLDTAYIHYCQNLILKTHLKHHPNRILISMPAAETELLKKILNPLKWKVISVEWPISFPILKNLTAANECRFGCFLGKNRIDITMQDERGQIYSSDAIEALYYWFNAMNSSSSAVASDLPAMYHHFYRSDKTQTSAEQNLSTAAMDCLKLDPVYICLILSQIQAKYGLIEILHHLPVIVRREIWMPCAVEQIALSLRKFVEGENESQPNLQDGISLHFQQAQVLLRPDADKNALKLTIESTREETADEIAAVYTQKLHQLLE